MDSGQEQNYWPGFVDALSNVVLTLVFVLVIFVFALAMSANKVEQKMNEVTKAEKATTQKQEKLQIDSQQIEDLKQQLAQAKAQLAAIQTNNVGKSKQEDVGDQSLRETSQLLENKEITVQKNDINPNAFEGAISVKSDQMGMLTLSFPATISQMDENSQKELGTTVDAMQAKGKAKRILIKSIMGKDTYSAAQRTAYYRAVNVRNFLITKLNANANDITSSIIEPDSSGIGRVEIIFQK